MIAAFFLKHGQKIITCLAVIVLLFCIRWAWATFIAEPYREQGRAEVQAKWDKREAFLADQYSKNLQAVIELERRNARAAQSLATQRMKELQNESIELATSLDRERIANKRLRTITGTTINASAERMSGVSDASPGSDGTCEAQLPAEIGAAFERLREGALRVGSEANTTAINLGASQETHRINNE